MGDAKRQSAALKQAHGRAHLFPVLHKETDLVLHTVSPAADILFHHLLEALKAHRRIVKIRNGLMQRLGRIVG